MELTKDVRDKIREGDWLCTCTSWYDDYTQDMVESYTYYRVTKATPKTYTVQKVELEYNAEPVAGTYSPTGFKYVDEKPQTIRRSTEYPQTRHFGRLFYKADIEFTDAK